MGMGRGSQGANGRRVQSVVMQDEHKGEGHALRMLGQEAQRSTISDDK